MSGAVIAGGAAPAGPVSGFGGGDFHAVWDSDGVVGGGFGNKVGSNNGDPNDAPFATVAGGVFNGASGYASTVAGGDGNLAGGVRSAVLGGAGNWALGINSAIAGGAHNFVHTNATDSFIGGGDNNRVQAFSTRAVIGGGHYNAVLATNAAVIGGGLANTNSGNYAVIAGGVSNVASAVGAFVGGGGQDGQYNLGNRATGPWSVVVGGAGNLASGDRAFIGGGGGNGTFGFARRGNTAGGSASAVVSGIGNSSPGTLAFVGGGIANTASGEGAVVCGGSAPGSPGLILNGNNFASGNYSVVPGGSYNVAGATCTFAAGQRAKANHDGAFVWADLQGADFASTAVNQFSARATGGARFVSGIDASGNPTAGVSLAAGGTSWGVISDRGAKKNFAPVDGVAVLEKLARVPVQQWNYTWEPHDAVPHLGPTAQDFKAAFYPGRDHKSITTQEIDGVALAAIQGLNQKIEEQLRERDREIAELKELVRQLARKVDGR